MLNVRSLLSRVGPWSFALALLEICLSGCGRTPLFLPPEDAGYSPLADALAFPEDGALDANREESTMDANREGGAPDAGLCSADRGCMPGGCRADGECDDGFACNGVEKCAGGRCAQGIALRCDDGV